MLQGLNFMLDFTTYILKKASSTITNSWLPKLWQNKEQNLMGLKRAKHYLKQKKKTWENPNETLSKLQTYIVKTIGQNIIEVWNIVKIKSTWCLLKVITIIIRYWGLHAPTQENKFMF
jgi:hypothetical protein